MRPGFKHGMFGHGYSLFNHYVYRFLRSYDSPKSKKIWMENVFHLLHIKTVCIGQHLFFENTVAVIFNINMVKLGKYLRNCEGKGMHLLACRVLTECNIF